MRGEVFGYAQGSVRVCSGEVFGCSGVRACVRERVRVCVNVCACLHKNALFRVGDLEQSPFFAPKGLDFYAQIGYNGVEKHGERLVKPYPAIGRGNAAAKQRHARRRR